MNDADPEQPDQRARDIFLRLIEIPFSEARAAYLEGACQSDSILRSQVEALMESHWGDTFLDYSAVEGLPTTLDDSPVLEGPGTQIGKYKLLQQIGEGGMGIVYMAEQAGDLRRQVALKIIKLGMDTKSVVARFEAERQALALMNHPNIAKVLDAGATETGRPYFVMELVRGVPITNYCDQQKLSTRERLDLFIPVCQAIQHAHQKGIIHRDIKPSNVMIALFDGRPVPMVIDFGIAKATNQRLTEHTVFTNFGQFMGTPAYMSPEQAEGSQLDIDTRSDIYSLGVLLYELITGSTPFQKQRLQKAGLKEMQRILLEEEPPRPSTRLNTIQKEERTKLAKNRGKETSAIGQFFHNDLDWIVMRAIEKDRTRRYDTANGLAMDVQRYLSNQPVLAVAPRATYRIRKFVVRHTAAVIVATVIVILLIAGITATTRFAVIAEDAKDEALRSAVDMDEERQRANEEQKKAEASAKTASTNEVLAQQERDRAEQALQQVQIQRADQLIQTGDIPTGQAYLTRVLLDNPTNQIAANNLVATLLNYTFAQPRTAPVHHQSSILGVRFSPDGHLWATFSSDSTIVIRDIKTGESLVPVINLIQPPTSAQFSSNGQWLLIGDEDGAAGVWSTETGQLISPILRHQGSVRDVQFSPDDERVITASSDKTTRIWNWRTGEEATPPLRHATALRRSRFSPNGRFVVTGSVAGTAQIWDATTGQPLGESMLHADEIRWISFSPDSLRVATASDDDTARIWEVPSGRPVGVAMHHTEDVVSVEFAPHGRTVATASSDNTARVWDARTGLPIGSPIRHVDEVRRARFSPDGQRLLTASVDNTARLWDVESGEQLGEPLRHTDWLYDAQFSPDGQSVATAAGDNTAILWDARVPRTLQQHFRHESPVHHAQFSPDGATLVTASADHIVRLWSVATGQHIRIIGRHDDAVRCVQFSVDGTRLVTASSDNTAYFWDVATGRRLAGPFRHEGPIYFAELSPDGISVVTGGRDRKMRIWDTRNSQPIIEPIHLGDKVFCVRFSPDGRKVLTSSGTRNARIWNVATESFEGPAFEHQGEVNSAQFSPDGSMVATASRDMTAQLWNAATGQPLTPPLIHQAPVTYVEFSPDGLRVVTGTDHGVARIWDSNTGEPLTGLFQHGDKVTSARFSPDGQRLVTASLDGIVRIWDVPTAEIPVPAWFVEGANAIGGKRLNSDNTPETVPLAELVDFRQRVLASAESGFYRDLASWLFAERSTRRISPLSQTTVTELIRQQIQENTLESLRDVLLLSPTNSIALSRKAALLEASNDPNLPGLEQEAALFRALSVKWTPLSAPPTGQ